MVEKLSVQTLDITQERLKELKHVFPEVFTEDKVDFDKLKQMLGEDVDTGPERYGLNWAGKSNAIRTIQTQSTGTLRPAPEESVDFDTTENLIIEGDNLEVLKLLQKSYYGKVKMIYIDPPYNTGNDFVYPDDYRDSIHNYLKQTGQVDENGDRLSTNGESSGRYHSNWLTMMYPRLFLARNMLKQDGVIFVSIDSHEVSNLRKLLDEVFGEENFIEEITWVKNATKNDSKDFATVHEYIICYAKNKLYRRENGFVFREPKPGFEEVMALKTKWETEMPSIEEAQLELRSFYRDNPQFKGLTQYKHVEISDESYCIFRKDNAAWPQGEGPKYNVIHPVTGKVCKTPNRGWRWTEQKMEQLLQDNLIAFGEDEKTVPQFKRYLDTMESNVVKSVVVNNDNGDNEIRGILESSIFTHPKPVSLIEFLIQISTDVNDIVLDFFAGSGTTAHSVLDLNKEDGGNRKFILVQLPEPVEDDQFSTIADITKERIRRVIQKHKEEGEQTFDFDEHPQDLGFKVFKLDTSNFKIWDGSNVETVDDLHQQLDFFVEHVKDDRTEADLVYEIILKAGLPLTVDMERVTLKDRPVYQIDQGALLVCVADQVDATLLRAMMDKQPEQIICLDHAFGERDELKTNTVLEMKAKQIAFRTI